MFLKFSSVQGFYFIEYLTLKKHIPVLITDPLAGPLSFAQVVGKGVEGGAASASGGSDSDLCPFYLFSGVCRNEEECQYTHGLFCELCQLACLHPFDEEQRTKHVEVRHPNGISLRV